MIWFPWKLGCITTIGGLANAGGLIVLYEGNVKLAFAGMFYRPELIKVGFFGGGYGHSGNMLGSSGIVL